MSAQKSYNAGYARAAASIVFAGVTVLLVRAHGILHWRILSHHYDEIPAPVRLELFGEMSRLVIASQLLALASVIWCVWSWRVETRMAAVIASVFAGLAFLLALMMVMT